MCIQEASVSNLNCVTDYHDAMFTSSTAIVHNHPLILPDNNICSLCSIIKQEYDPFSWM